LKLLFAAGGSGGHVEPALATAEALRQTDSDCEIMFVSSRGGVGETLIRNRGFDVTAIDAVPAPRGFSRASLDAPRSVWLAIEEVLKIIEAFRPTAVVGFGGYVAAPAYLAAKRKNLPLVVHEANAKAGWANRLGAKLTHFRAENHPGSLANAEVVGMPVRESLVDLDRAAHRLEARRHFGLEETRMTLLLTGGSQGARKLNEVTFEALEELSKIDVGVLHILGEKNLSDAPAPTRLYRPVGFVDDMRMAYSAADFICCRAGANTVAEVGLVGIPALFVPLPIGNGEQNLNAGPLVAAGLARSVSNDELNSRSLVDWVREAVAELSIFRSRLASNQDLVIRDGAQRLAQLVMRAASSKVAA